MKQITFILFSITIFAGCLSSSVPYTSSRVDNIDNNQYIEYQECRYLIGPFATNTEPKIEDVVNHTIEKAQNQGMYGEELVNIKITEDIFTLIIYSKLCVVVKGNLIE